MVAGGKCGLCVTEHLGEYGKHVAQVSQVLHVEAGSHRFGSGGERKQQVPDALKVDHALQAGKLLAGTCSTPEVASATATRSSISRSTSSRSPSYGTTRGSADLAHRL